MKLRNILFAMPAALIIAAGCADNRPESGHSDQNTTKSITVSDPLDGTIWTAYYAGGVGIVEFGGGAYTERFYDAITTRSEQSRRRYLLDGRKMLITESDNSVTEAWFELSNNELLIFADSVSETPNIRFRRFP